METLHSSRFVEHRFDPKTSTLYSVWHPETRDMDQEDFKAEMRRWLEVSRQCRPERLHDYCSDFNYVIQPEEQVWMAHLLNPSWVALGVVKYAHIVPEEFISSLAVEQMFEEFFEMRLPGQFEIKHLPGKEEAERWLNG